MMGLDIQNLVGSLYSYGCLVPGLPLLFVLMLEAVLGRQVGRHRMAMNMTAARRMGVTLVVVAVMEHM